MNQRARKWVIRKLVKFLANFIVDTYVPRHARRK